MHTYCKCICRYIRRYSIYVHTKTHTYVQYMYIPTVLHTYVHIYYITATLVHTQIPYKITFETHIHVGGFCHIICTVGRQYGDG